MSKKMPKKLIGGLVGITVILAGAYFLLGNSSGGSGSLETSTSTASGASNGIDTGQVVDQLNNLKRLQIDADFFNSDAFLSLKDFGVTINPQEVGRDNPFIPPSYSPTGEIIIPSNSEIEQQPIDINNDSGSEGSTTTTESTTTTSTTSTNTNSTTSTSTSTTTDESQQ